MLHPWKVKHGNGHNRVQNFYIDHTKMCAAEINNLSKLMNSLVQGGLLFSGL
jgi:hypothetical protein